MKQNEKKRLVMAAIILGTILVVSMVFAGVVQSRRMLASSKTQLQLSSSKLEQLKSQLANSLTEHFSETRSTNIEPSCTEELSGTTLTRNYDCTSGFKLSFAASSTASNESVFETLTTSLTNVNARYAAYDNSLDSYISEINRIGSWHNIFWVDDSGIPGVLPPQASDTVSEALAATEISINVNTSRISPQATTEISLSATQEYAACQSFFIPCDSYLTK